MRFISFAFALCLIFQVHANEQSTPLRDDLIKILPIELINLTSQTSSTDLQKKFSSKISGSKKDQAIFLNYFGIKNDVTLGIKNNHYEYTYLLLPRSLREKSTDLFSKAVQSISEKEKNKLNDQLNSTDHQSGELISIDLLSQGLKLEFYNNEKKDLKSVYIWPIPKASP